MISKTSSGPFIQNALYTIDKISEWSAKLTGYLVAIVMLLVTLEGVLRYFFNKPTAWSAELVTYLSGAVYCLGVAYVYQLGEHVKVDVFYNRFTPRARAILDLVTFPLFILFFGGVFWAGTEWALETLLEGKTSGTVWDPPLFPFRTVIPLGAFLALLQGMARFVRDFKTVLGEISKT